MWKPGATCGTTLQIEEDSEEEKPSYLGYTKRNGIEKYEMEKFSQEKKNRMENFRPLQSLTEMSLSTERSQGTDLGSQTPGKLPSAMPGSVWDTKHNAHTELMPLPSCFQLGQLFRGKINNYQYTRVYHPNVRKTTWRSCIS